MNGLEILLAITVLLCLAYGIDDLFIDVTYWLRLLVRKMKWKRIVPLEVEALNAKPEQRIAIMLPCWKENEVVGASLRNTLFTLQYSNYDVFVGVYPNDPETMSVVQSLKETLPHVHYAVCPNPGPTSKADNLNSMYLEILKHEREKGVRFDIFVIHDAEDVIHPLSLKLYNYLIPRKDMIQIPVFPLEVRLRNFTHWTYADEFAENHTKDILAREVIGGFVPSAGVGTALSRTAVDAIAQTERDANEPFSTKTLTEDYSFSLRLKELKLNSIFVHQSFVRIVQRKKWVFFGPLVPRHTREWIATRALFPTHYKSAVRQKSRWILGISLQEWRESGWVGNMATRYTLLRDRKGPMGHIICLLGYCFLAYFIALFLSERNGWDWNLPGITHGSEIVWTLLVVNLLFMCERILQRGVAVWRIYGFRPAFFSPIRVIYGNFINAHAFLVALSKFWTSVKTGRAPVWSKTSNTFPSTEQLTPYRRRLGDLLLASSMITPRALSQALTAQSARKGERLGTILVKEGHLTEENLMIFLGNLYAMPVVDMESVTDADLEKAKRLLTAGAREWLASRSLVPIGTTDGKLLVALADPTNENLKKDAERALSDKKIQFVIAPENQIQKVLAQ